MNHTCHLVEFMWRCIPANIPPPPKKKIKIKNKTKYVSVSPKAIVTKWIVSDWEWWLPAKHGRWNGMEIGTEVNVVISPATVAVGRLTKHHKLESGHVRLQVHYVPWMWDVPSWMWEVTRSRNKRMTWPLKWIRAVISPASWRMSTSVPAYRVSKAA